MNNGLSAANDNQFVIEIFNEIRIIFYAGLNGINIDLILRGNAESGVINT